MERPSLRSASSYQVNSTLRPRVAQRTYSLVHLEDEEATSMPARIAATLTLKNRPGLPLFCAYLLVLLFISPASSLGQTTSHSPGWVVLPVDEYRTLHTRAYPIERDPEPPPDRVRWDRPSCEGSGIHRQAKRPSPANAKWSVPRS